MSKLIKTAITLTAIGVAVKVVNKNKKSKSKPHNKVYFGSVGPTNPNEGDMWFNPNGEMKIY